MSLNKKKCSALISIEYFIVFLICIQVYSRKSNGYILLTSKLAPSADQQKHRRACVCVCMLSTSYTGSIVPLEFRQ